MNVMKVAGVDDSKSCNFDVCVCWRVGRLMSVGRMLRGVVWFYELRVVRMKLRH